MDWNWKNSRHYGSTKFVTSSKAGAIEFVVALFQTGSLGSSFKAALRSITTFGARPD